MQISFTEAKDRIIAAVNEGRHFACLIESIDDGINSSDKACAAMGMPEWLAILTIPLFDGLPTNEAAGFARRYGVSMKAWEKIDATGWARIETRFKMFCVRQALEAARPKGVIPNYWPAVEAACLRVLTALETGDKEELAAAASAARSAASTAESAAWSAARSAASAASTAARSAASAARSAESAAWSAARSAESSAARSAQFDALLTFIDQEIA